MMKNRYFNSQEEAGINITPMLDVVFIMLIFFIVTTSFNKETGLAVYKSNHASHQHKVKNAIIKLDASHHYSVNGVETTLDGIEPLLANLKASNPEIAAQIISSKNVRTGDLVKVIHQIKSNDIKKYSLNTY